MRYYNHERKQWTRKRMTPVAYRDHLLTKVEG
ncbi:MAG: IS3 family transposase, partial [Nitrospirota bacterium]